MLVAVAAVRSLNNFYETAVRLANCAQSNAAALEEKLLQIEIRKREVEAQLHIASLAHKRRPADFVPIHRADFTASNLQRTSKRTSDTEINRPVVQRQGVLGCRENEGPTQTADLKADNAGHC
jgi:hypothetical protein